MCGVVYDQQFAQQPKGLYSNVRGAFQNDSLTHQDVTATLHLKHAQH